MNSELVSNSDHWLVTVWTQSWWIIVITGWLQCELRAGEQWSLVGCSVNSELVNSDHWLAAVWTQSWSRLGYGYGYGWVVVLRTGGPLWRWPSRGACEPRPQPRVFYDLRAQTAPPLEGTPATQGGGTARTATRTGCWRSRSKDQGAINISAQSVSGNGPDGSRKLNIMRFLVDI